MLSHHLSPKVSLLYKQAQEGAPWGVKVLAADRKSSIFDAAKKSAITYLRRYILPVSEPNSILPDFQHGCQSSASLKLCSALCIRGASLLMHEKATCSEDQCSLVPWICMFVWLGCHKNSLWSHPHQRMRPYRLWGVEKSQSPSTPITLCSVTRVYRVCT